MSSKKVLLISVNEIIDNSVIEYNVDAKILAKTLSIAQETGLRPILGATLYDETINSVYNFVISGTPIDSKYSNIITASKPYLIAKTTSDFIITNQYKFTDKGIMKLNDNSASNISEGDLQSVTDYYSNLISTYKQDLIQFLEDAHLIDYRNDVQISSEATGWFLGVPVSINPIKTETIEYSDYIEPVVNGKFTYQQLSSFNNILLVNVQDIIGYSVIQDNVDIKLLSKTISTVQQVNLKPILGDKLFYSNLNAINNFIVSGTTIPALYRDLETFVKPYIINKTVAEFLIPNQYKVTNKGILKLNDVSATNISEGDLTAIKDYYDNLSTTYKENLISFLKKYNLTECYGDDNITSDATGWFLGGEFKGSSYNLDVEEAYNNDTYTTAIDFVNPILTLTDNLGGTLSTTISVPNITGLVPYIGAIDSVDLDGNSITAGGVFTNIIGAGSYGDYLEIYFNNTQSFLTFRNDEVSSRYATYVNLYNSKISENQTRDLYWPDSSGTFAMSVNGITADSTGNIILTLPSTAEFVPYTGATADVDLNSHNLIANNVVATSLYSNFIGSTTDSLFQIYSDVNLNAFYIDLRTGNNNPIFLNNSKLTPNTTHTYNLPNGNGTLPLSVNGTTANDNGNITIPIQSPIILTTTGTTGASTLIGANLNIPQYISSQWITDANGIDYIGNVGIGKQSSNIYKLDVSGNTRFNGQTAIGTTGYTYGTTVNSGGKLTINNLSGYNGLVIDSSNGASTGTYNFSINTALNDNIGVQFSWSDGNAGSFLQCANNTGTILGLNGTTSTVKGTTILFKQCTTEVARFAPSSGNLLIGKTGDIAGYKLQVQGNSILNGSVGVNTTTPNSSAILDLNSTTKGFLPPRMTSAERLAITPTVGLMVYQTDGVEGWYGYKSTGWKSFGTV